eukprot:CAMPEP_0115862610 /NCGR_PEP_ID=MMETSP0287-20121206/18265_1 /TAXON_ID=412157 /ORGANISM="Chrysochromulina rotalis, Strain UIO044" /LENGTH=70 /DNA_ID=CAMNT_0003317037 /DNA_START=873 /DNA_END=1083 /DNA_ORIENTATION=+
MATCKAQGQRCQQMFRMPPILQLQAHPGRAQVQAEPTQVQHAEQEEECNKARVQVGGGGLVQENAKVSVM